MKKQYTKPEAEIVDLSLTSIVMDSGDSLTVNTGSDQAVDPSNALSDESPIWDTEN